jgi:hypothetical protein
VSVAELAVDCPGLLDSAVCTVVVANLIAAGPGVLAARTWPAAALRAEWRPQLKEDAAVRWRQG